MNLKKIVTIDRLREFLNKFSKVAISGNYSDLSGVPTKVSQFTNDAGYAKETDIPIAGEGIKIENGVISVFNNKVGEPTCPGYTLYGEYFLSNTITPNKSWSEACAMTEDVVVTQDYILGEQIKTATAKTLSKEELETLTPEERKISENGHWWYWTSTPYIDTSAWFMNSNGYFLSNLITRSNDDGGARLGFKNPFLDIENLAVSKRQIFTLINMYSKNHFSFDSSKKILNISL